MTKFVAVKPWLLLLLVLLCSSARADESAVYQINTVPGGARVYQELNGAMADSLPEDFLLEPGSARPHGLLRQIGSSGEKLVVVFPGSGSDLQSNLTLWLVHPQCFTKRVSLVRNIGDAEQTVTLRYRSPWIGFQAQLPYWGPRIGLLLLVIVAPIVVVSRGKVAAAAASKLEAEAMRDKARRVTDLIVPGDIADPFIGARLDDYRILQRLGEGGMARVYRAVPEDSMDETEAVAIKVMNQELAREPELVKRFAREKKVYEDMHHPNIVKVLSSGVYEQQFYLAMELVRGSTMRAYVLPGGLPVKKVLQLMTPVFEAVGYANKKGIVHRDLKPENIMITDQGKVKVMDFGLARGSNYSQVTATGSVLGTPGYMAPEQIEGKLDIRSDQYALGVMLYEMLTGELPFYDENPVTIIISHLTKPVPSLAAKKPELVKLGPVVERMLAKDPEERYRDLDHALTSLRYVM